MSALDRLVYDALAKQGAKNLLGVASSVRLVNEKYSRLLPFFCVFCVAYGVLFFVCCALLADCCNVFQQPDDKKTAIKLLQYGLVSVYPCHCVCECVCCDVSVTLRIALCSHYYVSAFFG